MSISANVKKILLAKFKGKIFGVSNNHIDNLKKDDIISIDDIKKFSISFGSLIGAINFFDGEDRVKINYTLAEFEYCEDVIVSPEPSGQSFDIKIFAINSGEKLYIQEIKKYYKFVQIVDYKKYLAIS